MRLLAALTFCAATAIAWAEPFGFSVNSRGNFSEDDRVNALWRVNLATGQSEFIGPTGFLDVEALAFDGQERLFGADDESNTLLRIGTETGRGFPVANEQFNMALPLQPMDFGMTFTCQGRLLVVSDVEQSLFEADPETGRLTRIGPPGALGAPVTDLAAWGNLVFGIGQGTDAAGNPDAPYLFRIDTQLPAATVIGALGGEAAPYNNAGLDFDAQGRLWAVTDRRDVGGVDLPSEILRIDPASGRAAKVADAEIVGFESLAITGPGGCDGAPPASDEMSPDSALQIPVLNLPGLGILALLIIALAWAWFRPGRS